MRNELTLNGMKELNQNELMNIDGGAWPVVPLIILAIRLLLLEGDN